MKKSRARNYAYGRKSRERKRGGDFFAAYGAVIIAVCVIVAAFVVTVIVGNALGKKVGAGGDVTTPSETSAPSSPADVSHEFTYARNLPAPEYLDISELRDATFADSAIYGGSVTVNLRAENGKINYNSPAAVGFASASGFGTADNIGNPEFSPEKLFSALGRTGTHSTFCVKITAFSAENASARKIIMAYEAAIIEECAAFGADEIVLCGIGFGDGEDTDAVYAFISELSEKTGETKLGVALSPETLAATDETILFYNLSAVCDFAVIDFTGRETPEELTQFVTEHEYFITRYKLTFMLLRHNRENYSACSEYLQSHGIMWQKAKVILETAG